MTTFEYEQEVKKRLFELCMNLLESSAPPDLKMKSGKPVMLPLETYDQFMKLVIGELRSEGHPMPRDFDIEKLKREGLDAQKVKLSHNPSTPKIPDEIYDEMGFFFGPQGFFARNPAQAVAPKELERQFKASVMHLANLFLKVEEKLAPEDFEYPSKQELGIKLGKAPLDSDMKNAMKEATLAQYKRYFIAIVLLNMIKMSYQIKKDQIEQFMKLVGIDMESGLEKLRRGENRKAFARGVNNLMKNLFGDQDLGDAILSQVRKQRISKS